jgi:hypothetical protein
MLYLDYLPYKEKDMEQAIALGPQSIRTMDRHNTDYRWGKKGMNLVQLQDELERVESTKKDYQVRTNTLEYYNGSRPIFGIQGLDTPFEITAHTHQQIVNLFHDYTTKQSYDNLRNEHPFLHEQLIQGLIRQQPDDHQRLIRTLDGKARAMLSNSYATYDNYQAAHAVLKPMMDVNHFGFTLASANISDSHMYLKFITDIEGHVKDDVIYAGVQISNSEIGLGTLKASLLFARVACFNISSTSLSYGKTHKGARQQLDDGIVYSDRTQALDSAAVLSKLEDEVKYMTTPEVFEKHLEKYRLAANKPLNARDSEYAGPLRPTEPAVVEVTSRHIGLTKEESANVVEHYFNNSDRTVYGLANAITRTSKDASYDRATEMEKLGHNVVELNPKAWRHIYQLAEKN